MFIDREPRKISSLKRVSVAATASMTLAFGLAACEKSESQPSHSQPQSSPDSNLGEIYLNLPQGPCRPLSSLDDQQVKQQRAEKCLSAYRNGKIAFINFGTPSEKAQEIANTMKKTIAAASDRMITPSITVIPASPEAKDVLSKTANWSGGCIDAEDPTNFSSFAAARTMPELQKFDFVMAFSDKNSCNPLDGGVADILGGRYGEIFGNSAIGAHSVRILGHIGAHEGLHLFGLGHAGEVYGKTPEGYYSKLYLSSENTDNRSYDLKKYLRSSQYDEYADISNIMSSNMGGNNLLKINFIQRDILRWPQAKLKGDQVFAAQKVGKKWTRINAKDAAHGSYATVRLKEPIKLSDSETGSEETFDTLAFIPQIDAKKIYSGKMVLTDSANEKGTTVEMGDISTSGTNLQRIKYGTQVIEVKASKSLDLRVQDKLK